VRWASFVLFLELVLTNKAILWYSEGMATDLESFEEFIRQQRASGKTSSPEQMIRLWRRQSRSSTPTNGVPDATLYERLSAKGLLGCCEGGPDDLSSNPRHMEGFGES